MVKIWAAAVKQANSADPVKVDQTLNGGFTYPSSESVIGAEWQYSATDHDGIKEGEPVVTSANFLIDAESNLKAALKGLAGGGQP